MTVSKFLFNDVLYMFLFVSKLPRLQVNAVKTLRGPPLPAVVYVIKGRLPPDESHRHHVGEQHVSAVLSLLGNWIGHLLTT